MGALGKKLRTLEGGILSFQCPGCHECHAIPISGEHAWIWNGNIAAPTFTPSILVRSGHYVPGSNPDTCWCTYNAEHPSNPVHFKCGICHSFVIEGKFQFLSDCTHELAGRTVEIPDWKDD